MLALLEKAKEKLLGRQQKKSADFDALAVRLATGKTVAVEEITDELETLGRTAEELDAEVSRRQRRIADAGALAEVPALQEEAAEIQARGAAESQRYEALVRPLREEHERTLVALNGRYRYIVDRIPQAEAMRVKLLETYRGPLRDELDSNRQRQGELNREISTAAKLARRHEHDLSFVRKGDKEPLRVVHTPSESFIVGDPMWGKTTPEAAAQDALDMQAGMTPEEIENKKGILKSLRETLAKAQAELDALVKREAEILELMLQP
jgi:hypothetical protein